MKTKNLAFGLMAAVISTGAAAQAPSVTTYGKFDVGIGSVNNGANSAMKVMDGGTLFGFRGTEDLGSGLKANFLLEAGVNTDTGTGTINTSGGLTFTRQAYMGLEGTWGKLELGRMYTPMFLTLARVDPFVVNSAYSPSLLWVTPGQGQPQLQPMQVRADNAITYTSPSTFPVAFAFQYGFGESLAASTSSGNEFDVSVGYASGPFWVQLAYEERRSGTAAAPVASPTTSKNMLLAGTYSFTNFKLGASYGTQKVDVAANPNATLLSLYGTYTASGAWSFLGNITKRDLSGSSNNQTAIGLGANYNLSKRTYLYGRYLNVKNGGTAIQGISSQIGATIPVAGGTSSLISLGIFHTF